MTDARGGAATKPNPPVYDPKVDPETQKAIQDLLSSLTPDVHTALPGGGFPSWCKAHPALCRGSVLATGTFFTWLMTTLGGLEGIDDAGNKGPGNVK